jgi:hypothetical protein
MIRVVCRTSGRDDGLDRTNRQLQARWSKQVRGSLGSTLRTTGYIFQYPYEDIIECAKCMIT